jgi:hypothetical protein
MGITNTEQASEWTKDKDVNCHGPVLLLGSPSLPKLCEKVWFGIL